MKQLRFRAVDGVNVPSPPHVRVGVYKVIGKTYEPTVNGWVCDVEPYVFTAHGESTHEDLSFLRNCVRDGELTVVDEDTATQMGLSFKPAALPSVGPIARPRAEKEAS